jgi:hypothetical protein
MHIREAFCASSFAARLPGGRNGRDLVVAELGKCAYVSR